MGVRIATLDPGAMNLMTSLLGTHIDLVPIVAIMGQVGVNAVDSDAFQEADIMDITMSMTRHSLLVTSTEEIPAHIAEVFHLVSAGRPGPVLISITKSTRAKKVDFVRPPETGLLGYHPAVKPNARQVRGAARLVATAVRPVLHVGSGAIRSGISEAIVELSKLGNLLVVTTPTGCGSVLDPHLDHLGIPGMRGPVPMVTAL